MSITSGDNPGRRAPQQRLVKVKTKHTQTQGTKGKELKEKLKNSRYS
ncbi:MAG: hypothetical protein N2Z80_07430 [Hydrogenothermaceae bacterium]|nr:hypothetical protein [Hydrogenothermaceae bacterium]